MSVHVKSHRRGKSVVKAYTRMALNNPKREQTVRSLSKKIRVGDALFNRRSEPGRVMALMRHRSRSPKRGSNAGEFVLMTSKPRITYSRF